MDKQPGNDTLKQNIRDQATLLADLLTKSAEYQQYADAKARLLDDQQQAFILSQLRQQQMNLRFAQMLGEDFVEEEEDFEAIYATFCLEPVISDFLYAEGRLGRLIAEIQQIFGGKLDLWSELEIVSDAWYKELN